MGQPGHAPGDGIAGAVVQQAVPDAPVLEACGLAATVPHAPASVRALAHYITSRDGGFGAVRELAELILTAQGRLNDETARRRRTPTFIPN